MGKKGRQRLFALRFFSAFFPIGESVFLRLSVGRKRVCGAEIRRPAQFFLPPKKGGFFMGRNLTLKITFSAVAAALTFVATVFIQVPSVDGGYTNLSDAIIFLTAAFRRFVRLSGDNVLFFGHTRA